MTGVPRDRWKRPLIIPPEGGEAVAYTRVSTLAKALDDKSGFIPWGKRKTAEGLLRRPDLITRVAGVIANGDPDTDWDTKRALNDICEEACEAAGASQGSSAGTGMHELTEALDRGLVLEYVPETDMRRLDAYVDATAGYEVLGIETFVVNDTVRAGGTFDRLLRCPDGTVRVADIKTGKSDDKYPLGAATQIAIYANGQRYDPETHIRTALYPDIDLSTGLMIHLPATGGCRVIPLDIKRGWRAAQLAAEVHGDVRKWKAADLIRQGVAV